MDCAAVLQCARAQALVPVSLYHLIVSSFFFETLTTPKWRPAHHSLGVEIYSITLTSRVSKTAVILYVPTDVVSAAVVACFLLLSAPILLSDRLRSIVPSDELPASAGT